MHMAFCPYNQGDKLDDNLASFYKAKTYVAEHEICTTIEKSINLIALV